jgi:hypothetical protein
MDSSLLSGGRHCVPGPNTSVPAGKPQFNENVTAGQTDPAVAQKGAEGRNCLPNKS